jgi:hypothetical protein
VTQKAAGRDDPVVMGYEVQLDKQNRLELVLENRDDQDKQHTVVDGFWPLGGGSAGPAQSCGPFDVGEALEAGASVRGLGFTRRSRAGALYVASRPYSYRDVGAGFLKAGRWSRCWGGGNWRLRIEQGLSFSHDAHSASRLGHPDSLQLGE